MFLCFFSFYSLTLVPRSWWPGNFQEVQSLNRFLKRKLLQMSGLVSLQFHACLNKLFLKHVEIKDERDLKKSFCFALFCFFLPSETQTSKSESEVESPGQKKIRLSVPTTLVVCRSCALLKKKSHCMSPGTLVAPWNCRFCFHLCPVRFIYCFSLFSAQKRNLKRWITKILTVLRCQ